MDVHVLPVQRRRESRKAARAASRKFHTRKPKTVQRRHGSFEQFKTSVEFARSPATSVELAGSTRRMKGGIYPDRPWHYNPPSVVIRRLIRDSGTGAFFNAPTMLTE